MNLSDMYQAIFVNPYRLSTWQNLSDQKATAIMIFVAFYKLFMKYYKIHLVLQIGNNHCIPPSISDKAREIFCFNDKSETKIPKITNFKNLRGTFLRGKIPINL